MSIGYLMAQKERGQSLVEMAFGFMLILFVLLGLFDLGRLYFMYIALEDSAREAALYLALNSQCVDEASIAADGTSCANPNNAIYRAQQAANQEFDWDKMDVQVGLPAEGAGIGSNVTVTLHYPIELLTPVISNIVGATTLKLSVEATQPIMRESQDAN